MSSIFLRIYGGLLFTLVLVAVLSGISVTLINGMRQAEYREDMVGGTFRLIAETVATLPEAERKLWLEDWGKRLAISFELVSQEDSGLNQDQLESLKSKGIRVRMLDQSKALVITPLEGDTLLEGVVSSISEQTASGTLSLLKAKLMRFPEAHRAEKLKELSATFSYPVHLVEPYQTRLLPIQREQLQKAV